MELKELTFVTGQEGDAKPDTVTVKMTVEEALWVARIAGAQRGSSPHNEIYSCLVGDVFNRFWENGVDDAKKQYSFDIPPIKYDA